MQIPAREIKRGDELKLNDWNPEFVRKVTMVLHMSNGMDVAIEPDTMVEKLNV